MTDSKPAPGFIGQMWQKYVQPLLSLPFLCSMITNTVTAGLAALVPRNEHNHWKPEIVWIVKIGVA